MTKRMMMTMKKNELVLLRALMNIWMMMMDDGRKKRRKRKRRKKIDKNRDTVVCDIDTRFLQPIDTVLRADHAHMRGIAVHYMLVLDVG